MPVHVTAVNTRSPAAGSDGSVTVSAADVGADPAGSSNTVARTIPSRQNAGTAVTLAVADMGAVVEFTAGTAVTVTIPAAATLDLGTDVWVGLYQQGAGQVTVAGAAGVTLRTPNGARTAKQYSEVSVRRRGSTDIWVVSGDTV